MDGGGGVQKPVRVTIFNESYSLLASEEPGAVEEIARTVDHLMHSIAERAGLADPARVAVLACLHLADQLRMIEREQERLRERMDEKAKRFSLLLDEAFGEKPEGA